MNEGTLDSILKDLPKFQREKEKLDKEVKAKKVKILGKRAKLPFWHLTDDEISQVYGEKSDVIQKKKEEILAKIPVSKARKVVARDNIVKGSVQDQLLGSALGYTRGMKGEEKDGVFTYVNDSGKFKMRAVVDTKNKTVKFKGQTDDMLALMFSPAYDRLGYKFISDK